jgi:hypothetical protein
MTIFFFLIGLEVKREVMEGHLSSIQQVDFPLHSIDVLVAKNRDEEGIISKMIHGGKCN